MNITQKAREVREAVAGLNSLQEGLRGLSEAVIPTDRIRAIMGSTIVPLIANLESKTDRAVATCEQTTGEAVQGMATSYEHLRQRLSESEAKLEALAQTVDELVESLDSLARKRRKG